MPKPTPLEELYTAPGVARVLVTSPMTVHRLTRIGVLKACAVSVGPHRSLLLYRRADVDALAAKRNRPQRTPTKTERRRL